MSVSDYLINISMESKFPGAKKVGNSYLMLCPFHDDKNPSLSVFPEGNYHCFGCGEKGNYVSFLMKTRSMTLREAYEEIENLTGVKLREDDPEKEKFHRINELAVQFYCKQLSKASHVRDYLAKRGITDESIEKFRLGYASGAGLLKELKSYGFTVQEIRKAGLLRASDEQEFFLKRLMFPIINGDGKTYGFAGRTLQSNGAKYINSPETTYFKKGSLLYGLDVQAVKTQGHIIIVEGYIDAIAMHQKGYRNTAALMGTAFGDKQLEIIKRITDKAIIAGDGDNAGTKAAVRIVKQLIYHIDVSVIDFQDEDPASFIEKGGDIAEAISGRRSAAAYLIEKVTDAKERQEIIHTLAVNCSVPEFLCSLDDRERYMFAEISARELLTSLREKMKLLVRLKNTKIEVRQWSEMAIAFSDGKMALFAKLPKDTKKHKDTAVELARAVYRSILQAKKN